MYYTGEQSRDVHICMRCYQQQYGRRPELAGERFLPEHPTRAWDDDEDDARSSEASFCSLEEAFDYSVAGGSAPGGFAYGVALERPGPGGWGPTTGVVGFQVSGPLPAKGSVPALVPGQGQGPTSPLSLAVAALSEHAPVSAPAAIGAVGAGDAVAGDQSAGADGSLDPEDPPRKPGRTYQVRAYFLVRGYGGEGDGARVLPVWTGWGPSLH